MGEAGRRRAIEHFAWPAIAAETAALYDACWSARPDHLALARGAARARARLLAAGADERGARRHAQLRADARGRTGASAGRAPPAASGISRWRRSGIRGVAERANTARALEDDLGGYLGQPDMRELVTCRTRPRLDAARLRGGHRPRARLDDWSSQEAINWREDQQARNLGAVVSGLQRRRAILVWCGGGHLYRKPYEVALGEDDAGVWIPMGSLVEGYGGVEPFAIDQILSVAWGDHERPWLDIYADDLRAHGGTAGFLAPDLPEEHTSHSTAPSWTPTSSRSTTRCITGVWPATCGLTGLADLTRPATRTSMSMRHWYESGVERRRVDGISASDGARELSRRHVRMPAGLRLVRKAGVRSQDRGQTRILRARPQP